METIKFRGQRTETKEWICGDLAHIYNRIPCIMPEWCMSSVPDDEEMKRNKEMLLGGFMEVIPETVGQFTGLKDSLGNDIYEGDILLSSNENGIFLQLIGFGNDDREYSGMLNGFKIIDGRLLENDDYEIDECKEFTQELIKAHNIPILQPENTIIDGWWVIGNIYENKKLLEENN